LKVIKRYSISCSVKVLPYLKIRPRVVAYHTATVAYPAILFGGGSTNLVEDRENGDLGAVAP